jgi:hypothetical protein
MKPKNLNAFFESSGAYVAVFKIIIIVLSIPGVEVQTTCLSGVNQILHVSVEKRRKCNDYKRKRTIQGEKKSSSRTYLLFI